MFYWTARTLKPSIMATGSEVAIAVAAAKQLHEAGRCVRVVSVPALDVFEQQDNAYKDEVLPPQIKKRIAIEAANSAVWYKYANTVLDLNCFGLSAPAPQIFDALELTVEKLLSFF